MLIDIENIYKKFDSTGFAFLDEFEIPYSELTTLLLIFDFNLFDRTQSIDFFVHQYRKIESEDIKKLKTQLQKFLDFYIHNLNKPAFSNFLELSAKTYLNNYKNKYSNEYNYPVLPKNLISDSIYCDLVTGFDFINLYDQLDKTIDYYLVDKSIFTCKCLELKAKEHNLLNVHILNKDVLSLDLADFTKTLGIVRAKNIFKYVPLFLTQLIFFKDLLPTNGRFVFQERSADLIIFNEELHYYKIKDLFLDGWNYEEVYGDKSNPLDLDSMIFTKIK